MLLESNHLLVLYGSQSTKKYLCHVNMTCIFYTVARYVVGIDKFKETPSIFITPSSEHTPMMTMTVQASPTPHHIEVQQQY